MADQVMRTTATPTKDQTLWQTLWTASWALKSTGSGSNACRSRRQGAEPGSLDEEAVL